MRLERELTKPDVYCCRLVSDHGEMVRRLRMRADGDPPEVGAVVLYYAERAQLIDEYDDITEWARDFEKDLSAPGVLDEFQQLVDDRRDVELLLSLKVFNDLQAGLAISQAIGRARPG